MSDAVSGELGFWLLGTGKGRSNMMQNAFRLVVVSTVAFTDGCGWVGTRRLC